MTSQQTVIADVRKQLFHAAQLHTPDSTLFEGFNGFAGIADSHNIGGNILCDHRAGTDHNVIPDGYAGIDNRIAADPYIIANDNRLGSFHTGTAKFRINRMTYRENTNPRCQQAVLADTHLAYV